MRLLETLKLVSQVVTVAGFDVSNDVWEDLKFDNMAQEWLECGTNVIKMQVFWNKMQES